MKKCSLNFISSNVFAALLMFAIVAGISSSCSDDLTEVKDVAPDGTLEIYFRGYTIGSSGSSQTPPVFTSDPPTPFTAVAGVVYTLDDGRTFTSDANGKMTITLPVGSYRYRATMPSGWSPMWEYEWQSSSNYTYKTVNVRYEGDFDYDILYIYGPGRFIRMDEPSTGGGWRRSSFLYRN